MMYVATHPGLPGPITLTQEEATYANALMADGKPSVVLNGLTLPTGGLLIYEHEKFLKADRDALAQKRQNRCAWGTIHDTSENPDHSDCERRMRDNEDSPYIDFDRVNRIELRRLEAPEQHDDLPSQDLGTTLEQAMARALKNGTAKPTTVANTTVKLLERGHNVFRTLVRSYRLDPSLVPEKYRGFCASCGETPIDDVPLKPPFNVDVKAYQPMPS